MARQQRKGRASIWTLKAMILAAPIATLATITNIDGVSTEIESSPFAKRDMTAGSSCSEEGRWNCMGTSWQRCAAGQWSVVMQCATGTECTPSGLTYDFAVESSNGGGASTSGTVTAAASRTGTSRTGPPTTGPAVAGAFAGRNWWILALTGAAVSCVLR
ncbi:hypothetical protein BJ170DRAFT_12716 [Xylariales sp. AK1849]|nr:hypothetical protein BJ170DRAFT_12716 [Xylariales sp. AK1849]